MPICKTGILQIHGKRGFTAVTKATPDIFQFSVKVH
jgi:hypothetical protein